MIALVSKLHLGTQSSRAGAVSPTANGSTTAQTRPFPSATWERGEHRMNRAFNAPSVEGGRIPGALPQAVNEVAPLARGTCGAPQTLCADRIGFPQRALSRNLRSMESLYFVGLAVMGLFAFIIFILVFRFFGFWLRARVANAPVGLIKMFGMSLRKVPVGMIVDNRITAVKAGLDIPSDPLEAHYLAGGDVGHVILALIAADKAGISLAFNRACAIDLATKGTGKTVLEAVRTSINPKGIDAPSANMGRTTIDGVAQDGIGVKVKARVTVRSHLDRFVGGATEETIIARVGEGIVSSIGTAASYKDVLENPDRISKTVLAKGLDSGTAFEILSIDIADVDVGENIGAKLQTEQADADKRVAQAKAEVRRAAAVDAEPELRAKTLEVRAKVVEAEAQVPLAMAEAFRSGNFGIMDYVRMKNIEADTQMRGSIAGGERGQQGGEHQK